MEAEFFFSSVEHKAFFLDQLAEAKRRKKRQDSYFKSLAYLCGLTAETRNHFSDIFDLSDWSIRPEAAEAGWQTGTSLRVTRLAFNLWNSCGSDGGSGATEEYLPDNLFCCELMEAFFEALRIRFPEYAGLRQNKIPYLGKTP